MPNKDGTGPSGKGPKKTNQGVPARDGSGGGKGRKGQGGGKGKKGK